ncbi:MAG: hypothetical protein ACLFTB_06155 [Desulfovibrionales bacterium]
MYGYLFGEYCHEQGIVTRLQLKKCLELQSGRNHPLGLLAMDIGYLDSSHIVAILDEQKRTGNNFGDTAVSLGFLSPEILDDLLERQAEEHLRLGQVMVDQNILTYQRLETLLADFHVKNTELAETLSRNLEEHPQGPCLSVLAVAAHRIFSMGVGHVKIREVSNKPLSTAPGNRTISIIHDQEDGPFFEYGWIFPRSMIFPLVYCLTQKKTMSPRLVDKALYNLAEVIDYEFVREVVSRGIRLRQGKPGGQIPDPGGEATHIAMHATIGEFTMYFRGRKTAL